MEPETHRPPSATDGDALSPRWPFWAALGVVTAFFGAVRIGGVFNDLWLDEIWSLHLLQRVDSPEQILTRVLHDNNHPLNSLFLYWLMPAKADWTYRLLSWFMGTATVWLAALIARRQYAHLHPEPTAARAAGFLTAVIVGGSYLMIHYSSEARGYAPAVAGGFLAFLALLHAAGRRGGGWAVIYGFACGLGLLSHLVMVQVMLAGLVWSGVMAVRTWPGWRDRLVHLACWHLGPWLFFAGYYGAFVRRLEIGGGPQNPPGSVLGDLAAYTLGFPAAAGVGVALPVFLVVVLAGLVAIWRRDRALAAFYLTATFIAPALGAAGSRFNLLFPRYFIMSAGCALLLAGYGLARLWCSRPPLRVAGMAALAGFLCGNTVHTARLMRDGRGQYRQAIRYVAEHTPTAVVTVTSDVDLRNFAVVEYHRRILGPGRSLEQYAQDRLPPGGTQWFFYHRLDGAEVPPPELQAENGARYRFDRAFPHAALSGWDWHVYRSTDPAILGPVNR